MKLFDVCSSKEDHFVERLVNQIKGKFGDVPIFVTGFSLGGNYFLRGLGECENGKVDGIRAFATIC
jgi:predicted alpha/beta-fold hydrolase